MTTEEMINGLRSDLKKHTDNWALEPMDNYSNGVVHGIRLALIHLDIYELVTETNQTENR